ncbi:hypothetical protein AAHE18_14G004100 [Arachis hypogaea]
MSPKLALCHLLIGVVKAFDLSVNCISPNPLHLSLTILRKPSCLNQESRLRNSLGPSLNFLSSTKIRQ